MESVVIDVCSDKHSVSGTLLILRILQILAMELMNL